MRIYNRALTAAEVLNIYNSRAGGVQTLNASSQTLTNGSSLQNGLVGLWTFDGKDVTDKVYDRSGQGNNGYFIGAATSSAKVIGKMGQALQFNGSTSYVSLPANVLKAVNSGASLSLWVKTTTTVTNHPLISIKGYYVVYLGFNGVAGKVTAAFDGSSAGAPSSSSAYNDGKWHNVVAENNGNLTTVYVDGASVVSYSETISSDLSAVTDVSTIGSQFNGTSLFGGTIDDVRIYNRALSASEVKQLYLMGT